MKIACFSDIHGNKLALDAVLSDIESKSADKIFVLGDFAMGGYDPNYAIEKIFSLQDCEKIQGNTDKLILDNVTNLNNPLMASVLRLDIKEITPDNKIKLSSLSETKTVEYDGIKFFLCHGSPRKQDENLFPDTPLSVIEEACSDIEADIILCGHTHIPCGFTLNSGKIVANVGSIGRSMTKDKMPVYALIAINSNGEYSIEHIKVKYDNIKTANLIKERNFDNALEFSKLYL